ncbi:MAG: TadE/TadG family type IV pilus assembly protein [Planctomycetota bacterium]
MKKIDKETSQKQRDAQSGVAMVEFAIVFPLQLLIFLLGLQLCLIIVGKQVVNYAAFSAARAELVRGTGMPGEPLEEKGEAAGEAAVIACTAIGGTATNGSSFPSIELPGWEGSSPDLDILSQRAREKLQAVSGDSSRLVEVIEGASDGTGRVVVRVRFAYELMIPLANWVIYYALDGMNPGLVHFDSVENSGASPDQAIATVIGNVPHLVIQEDGVLSANWPSPTEEPHDVIEDPEEYEEP